MQEYNLHRLLSSFIHCQIVLGYDVLAKADERYTMVGFFPSTDESPAQILLDRSSLYHPSMLDRLLVMQQ